MTKASMKSDDHSMLNELVKVRGAIEPCISKVALLTDLLFLYRDDDDGGEIFSPGGLKGLRAFLLGIEDDLCEVAVKIDTITGKCQKENV